MLLQIYGVHLVYTENAQRASRWSHQGRDIAVSPSLCEEASAWTLFDLSFLDCLFFESSDLSLIWSGVFVAFAVIGAPVADLPAFGKVRGRRLICPPNSSFLHLLYFSSAWFLSPVSKLMWPPALVPRHISAIAARGRKSCCNQRLRGENGNDS